MKRQVGKRGTTKLEGETDWSIKMWKKKTGGGKPQYNSFSKKYPLGILWWINANYTHTHTYMGNIRSTTIRRGSTTSHLFLLFCVGSSACTHKVLFFVPPTPLTPTSLPLSPLSLSSLRCFFLPHRGPSAPQELCRCSYVLSFFIS